MKYTLLLLFTLVTIPCYGQVLTIDQAQDALVRARIDQAIKTHPEIWLREDIPILQRLGMLTISVHMPNANERLSSLPASVGCDQDFSVHCQPNMDFDGGWLLNPPVSVEAYQEILWHEAIHAHHWLFQQLPSSCFDDLHHETDPEVERYYHCLAELLAYYEQAQYDGKHGINCQHRVCHKYRTEGLDEMAKAVVNTLLESAHVMGKDWSLHCSVMRQAARDFVEQVKRNEAL